MRVFIKCKSPLLQRVLDKMLKKEKTTNLKICDFCVSDAKIKNKETFIIGKDIPHPFTKEQLLRQLDEFSTKIYTQDIKQNLNSTLKEIKKLQKIKIEKLAKKLS